jgi:hypothetical protein
MCLRAVRGGGGELVELGAMPYIHSFACLPLKTALHSDFTPWRLLLFFSMVFFYEQNARSKITVHATSCAVLCLASAATVWLLRAAHDHNASGTASCLQLTFRGCMRFTPATGGAPCLEECCLLRLWQAMCTPERSKGEHKRHSV